MGFLEMPQTIGLRDIPVFGVARICQWATMIVALGAQLGEVVTWVTVGYSQTTLTGTTGLIAKPIFESFQLFDQYESRAGIYVREAALILDR